MSLLALFCARNEAYHLPYFLRHLAPYVDGFLALDDGSIDETPRILEREPRMLDVLSNPPRPDDLELREPENRGRLLARAFAVGGRWAICLDPDERLELAGLRRLGQLRRRAERAGKTLVNFRLRELWDSPFYYRVDGIWGRKIRTRLIEIPTPGSFQGLPLHGPWHPDEYSPSGRVLCDHASIYHLKMIRAEDRELRRRRFRQLDPENRWQPGLGYDYLTDHEHLALNRILPWRAYARDSIPPDLLSLRPKLGAVTRLRSEALRLIDGARFLVRRGPRTRLRS